MLFIADLPACDFIPNATFANDTVLISTSDQQNVTTNNLQEAVKKVTSWRKNWKIKFNEAKSTHTTFTLKNYSYQLIVKNGVIVLKQDASNISEKALGFQIKLETPCQNETPRSTSDEEMFIGYWDINPS